MNFICFQNAMQHEKPFKAFANHMACGKIDSDGSYVLGSLDQKDGLPPGTYQAYISDAFRNLNDAATDGESETEPLAAEKFTSFRNPD